MICEVCKQRDADIVFKTVAAGQVATRAMCLGCAKTIQQDMMRMFLMLGFQPEVQQEHEQENVTQKPETRQNIPSFLCTHCGRPFDTLNEQTMAGCAHCYDGMQEQLNKQLEENKSPMNAPVENGEEDHAPVLSGSEDQELKFQLMEAVIKEDYETAARLRDRLASLQMEPGNDA